MRKEERSVDSIVEVDVVVEPEEVESWLSESDEFGDDAEWGDAPQERLKSAVVARAEHELLNERIPSPLTRPLMVATEDVRKGEPFRFSMSFAVLPTAELSSYERISLPGKRPEVTDEELRRLYESTIGGVMATTPKPDGAVVEDSDTVDLSLESESEGKAYHPLTASKRYYEMGSGFMPKDFDDMLRGMKVGETATVDLKVPKADTPTSESDGYRDVRVKATVNGIMSDDASSVDDDWIRAQFPGIAGVDELKGALRSQLAAEKDAMYLEAVESLLLQKLASRLEGANIPDAVIELQAAEALEAVRRQLEEQGRTLDDFMKAQNMDEQQMRISLMMDVRDQDRQMMALDAWSRHYGLRPTREDRDEYVSLIANGVGADEAEKVLATMYDGALEESVLRMMAQRDLPA